MDVSTHLQEQKNSVHKIDRRLRHCIDGFDVNITYERKPQAVGFRRTIRKAAQTLIDLYTICVSQETCVMYVLLFIFLFLRLKKKN